MAINFPDSPTNGQQTSAGGNTWQYNSTKSVWEKTLTSGKNNLGITVYATVDDLPLSGVSAGAQAFVTGSNRLYISNGTGWYSIGLVNTNPSITSVQDASAGTTPFTLATDGSALVLTVTAADPEGLPLTYSYAVTTGSLTNGGGTTATVVQGTGANTNQFTITPTATEAYAGTFDLTFTASDGINQASSVNSFTLNFITLITNSKYTSLLATATGTSDNNNITDTSTNNHSITVNGDAYAGTFSPYRSGGYSLGFAGDSYITLSNSSTFELTGDFCIDGFWYLPTTNSGTIFELGQYQNGILLSPDQYDNGIYVNGSKLTGLASSVTTNTWQHFAIVRKGSGSNNFKLYIDGTKVAESTITANINSNYSSYTNIRIGSATHSSSAAFDLDDGSYIRDLRIVKGDSVYPSSGDSVPPNSITVPTEKSTAITGTILFAGSLPYLADASTTNSTFTATNTVSTKAFSPYDYAEYSAADHGGSVYFDGTGDALRIADNSNIQLGTSPFTIEGWFYCTDTAPTQGILAKRDGSSDYWRWIIAAGNLNFRFQSTGLGSFTCNSVTIPSNTWCHFAVTRDNNNDVRQFVNGISTQSAINSTGNFDISGASLRVGEYELNTGHFNGYISDIKIVKNSALYTSNFTPPTAPLSSSGTELHIKGTDASIIDKAQVGNLELVETTGSTARFKFTNTKSMYVGGNSSAKIRLDETNPIYNLSYGQGDFTVEGWFYAIDNTNNPKFYMDAISASTYWQLYYLSGTGITLRANNTGIYSTETGNSFTESTWHHIALSRSGSNYKVFHNGTEIINVTSTHQIGSNSQKTIGGTDLNTGNNLRGYIQDFRITKGLARYTANFTPPTAPLEG